MLQPREGYCRAQGCTGYCFSAALLLLYVCFLAALLHFYTLAPLHPCTLAHLHPCTLAPTLPSLPSCTIEITNPCPQERLQRELSSARAGQLVAQRTKLPVPAHLPLEEKNQELGQLRNQLAARKLPVESLLDLEVSGGDIALNVLALALALALAV